MSAAAQAKTDAPENPSSEMEKARDAPSSQKLPRKNEKAIEAAQAIANTLAAVGAKYADDGTIGAMALIVSTPDGTFVQTIEMTKPKEDGEPIARETISALLHAGMEAKRWGNKIIGEIIKAIQ